MPICDNSEAKKIHRFSHNLDDSRPLNNEDISEAYYSALRRNTQDILPESTNLKPTVRMRRITSKQ